MFSFKHNLFKVSKKIFLIAIASFLVLIGITAIDQKTNFFSKTGHNIALGIDSIFLTGKFGTPIINDALAQVSGTYTNVQGDVAISGNTEIAGDIGTDNYQLTISHRSSGSRRAGLNLRVDSTNLWQILADNSDGNKLKIGYNNLASIPMVINTVGSVGIGTTDPNRKLEVYNGVNGYDTDILRTSLTYNSTIYSAGLGVDARGSNWGTSLFQNGNKVFTAENNYGIIVGQNYLGSNNAPASGAIIEGNVGIGTASPHTKLEINGDSNLTYHNGFQFDVPATTTQNRWLRFSQTANLFSIQGYETGGTTEGPTTDSRIALQPSGGNVGIGTTAPGEKLDVNGNIKLSQATSYIYGASTMYIGPTTTDNRFFYGSHTYINTPSSANTYFQVAGVNKMILDQYGNVGIGITNPTQKLDVNGIVNATDFYKNGVAFSGGSSQWTTSGTSIYYGSGNVGIGTVTPGTKLQINPPTAVEGLKVVSSNWSPLVIRNTGDAADLFRVDENGTMTQSGGYAYLGKYNTGTGPTRPRSGTDLAVGWNYSSGQRDMSFWNTDINNTTGISFVFRQLTGASSHKDLLNILSSGNVGIGTAAPGAPLEVDGTSGSGIIRIRNTATAAGKYWQIGPDGSNNIVIYNQSGNTGAYMLDSNPSYWGFNSDQRLKTNIRTLTSEKGLAAIEKLNPVTFNWIDTKSTKAPQTGFIAQDVQKVLPELVSIGPEATITLPDGSTQKIPNTLGLSSTGLIPHLVKAIQEQQTEIKQLQADNAALNLRLKALEDKIQ